VGDLTSFSVCYCCLLSSLPLTLHQTADSRCQGGDIAPVPGVFCQCRLDDLM
jgi:hypothetical protein